MNEVILMIIIFFVLDNLLTYYNVINYKKLFPEKKHSEIELNFLVGYFWDKFGLLWGGILGTIVEIIGITLAILYLPENTLYMLIGAYFIVILIHIDNFQRIRKKLNKTSKVKWSNLVNVSLFLFSFIDLLLTYIYISNYHSWRPDVALNQMENNPLLVFLMNNLGITFGMILGALIIWFLIYIVVKKANIIIKVILLIALCLTLYINITNLVSLYDLIKLYPLGVAT